MDTYIEGLYLAPSYLNFFQSPPKQCTSFHSRKVKIKRECLKWKPYSLKICFCKSYKITVLIIIISYWTFCCFRLNTIPQMPEVSGLRYTTAKSIGNGNADARPRPLPPSGGMLLHTNLLSASWKAVWQPLSRLFYYVVSAYTFSWTRVWSVRCRLLRRIGVNVAVELNLMPAEYVRPTEVDVVGAAFSFTVQYHTHWVISTGFTGPRSDVALAFLSSRQHFVQLIWWHRKRSNL